MSKVCYICGHEIKEGEPYYCIGPNSYTCGTDECYRKYFWDRLSARWIVPNQHEYFVTNNSLYQIGSDTDEPRGMDGNYYKIQFEDGTIKETHSLWFIAVIPKDRRDFFKENAHFVEKVAYKDK